MIRVLMVAAALIVAGAAVSLPAIAQPASVKGERVVESRVVSVRGDQVFLHDTGRRMGQRDVERTLGRLLAVGSNRRRDDTE